MKRYNEIKNKKKGTKTYINHDERLGDEYEFTMPQMIKIYRSNKWDRKDGKKMTDDEIISDVLTMDIEEVI